jgi:hypothetical protein
MADTPFEQLVVALATKCTGDESVLLLPGEETDTPANEHTDSASMQTRVFIFTPANWSRAAIRINAYRAMRGPEQNWQAL